MILYLFLALLFVLVFFIGRLLEKINVPWIFSALLIGLVFSAFKINLKFFHTSEFSFLANLGLFFMLFLIGFEIDVNTLLKQKSLVLKTTFIIIVTEALVGGLLLYFLFNIKFYVAMIVGLSFATIGEVALYPILDKYNLVKTKVGQFALNVGVFDDVFEVLTIILLSFVLSSTLGNTFFTTFLYFLLLIGLFFSMLIFSKFKERHNFMINHSFSAFFMFSLGILFLFLGIGDKVDAAALGALLAGIALKNFIPENILCYYEKDIKVIAYGFFAPIFFFYVGLETDISVFFTHPLYILLIIIVIKLTKIISTYLTTYKEFGFHKALFLGVSFTVKFSTSIVILTFFYNNGLISSLVYSILISVKILFEFIVPFILSSIIKVWKIHIMD